MPRVCLQFMTVVFPDHTHYLNTGRQVYILNSVRGSIKFLSEGIHFNVDVFFLFCF